MERWELAVQVVVISIIFIVAFHIFTTAAAVAGPPTNYSNSVTFTKVMAPVVVVFVWGSIKYAPARL